MENNSGNLKAEITDVEGGYKIFWPKALNWMQNPRAGFRMVQEMQSHRAPSKGGVQLCTKLSNPLPIPSRPLPPQPSLPTCWGVAWVPPAEVPQRHQHCARQGGGGGGCSLVEMGSTRSRRNERQKGDINYYCTRTEPHQR